MPVVPTAAAELLRMDDIPASVRTLNLGGEPLPNGLAQALYGLGTFEKVGNPVVAAGAVANTQALEPVPLGAARDACFRRCDGGPFNLRPLSKQASPGRIGSAGARSHQMHTSNSTRVFAGADATRAPFFPSAPANLVRSERAGQPWLQPESWGSAIPTTTLRSPVKGERACAISMLSSSSTSPFSQGKTSASAS